MNNGSSQIFCDFFSTPDPEDLFTLLEKLGQGAYGIVYKAVHKISKMTVAVKIIPNPSINNNTSIEREISLMKLVKESEYIIQYYGSYYSKKNNTIWIILEYAEGGSAYDLMSAMDREFNETEIASIIEMTLYGLIAMHQKNLIHRDIKAANILLTKEGIVKLGDFGTGEKLEKNKPIKSSKKGSLYWMSPQVMNYSEYDCKTDIWSLGITCIELCECEPPLTEYKPFKLNQILNENPPTGLPKGNKYSKEFNDFVSKCLIYEPVKRPSAKELLKHSFIVKYSKGRELIKNLIENNKAVIDDYRKNKEDYDYNESNSKNSNNKISESKGESIKEEQNEEILNNSIIVVDNKNQNKNDSIPEFMKFIDKGNFIFDINEKNNNINIEENEDSKGKSNEVSDSVENYNNSEKTTLSDRTILNVKFDELKESQRLFTLNQIRNSELMNKNNQIKEKFSSKTKDSNLSLEELCKDDEIGNLDFLRVSTKIQNLKLNKQYEMNLIDSKYMTQIEKFEYIQNSLRNFPAVKNLKEIVEKYYPKEKSHNIYDSELTSDNNNSNKIKRNDVSKLRNTTKPKLSNFNEEDNILSNDEMISINIPKFNTHQNYFHK